MRLRHLDLAIIVLALLSLIVTSYYLRRESPPDPVVDNPIIIEKSETLLGIKATVAIDRAGFMKLTFLNASSSPIELQHAVEEAFQGLRNVVAVQIRDASGKTAFVNKRPMNNAGHITLFDISGKIFFKDPDFTILDPGDSYKKTVNVRAALARWKLDTIEGSQVRFIVRQNFLRRDWLVDEMKGLVTRRDGVAWYPGTIETEWIHFADWPLLDRH